MISAIVAGAALAGPTTAAAQESSEAFGSSSSSCSFIEQIGSLFGSSDCEASPRPSTPDRAADQTADRAADQMAADIARLTNEHRKRNGLPPLKFNADMSEVAQSWSGRLAKAGTLSHNPAYSKEIPQGWRVASENVLQNWKQASADQLVKQWINSPGHNANMLNPDITDIGVGYYVGPDGRAWATQNFARY
ncbi:uncharacterized protein YkwD [Rhodococcus sp. PvR044]|uniref:CAP domain-containing protein n=1 Tax=unclassified Rhodococcus (in: high G+C Gram-positive bacteria) TaxID=192944 RepID=UPI001AE8A1A1|nr:CAP domain-containing protein [Rhodococcus sp. PvR099]MBP1159384.1 uncharacterized protein YkwD [Rhodococcus sp. PvR099]